MFKDWLWDVAGNHRKNFFRPVLSCERASARWESRKRGGVWKYDFHNRSISAARRNRRPLGHCDRVRTACVDGGTRINCNATTARIRRAIFAIHKFRVWWNVSQCAIIAVHTLVAALFCGGCDYEFSEPKLGNDVSALRWMCAWIHLLEWIGMR